MIVPLPESKIFKHLQDTAVSSQVLNAALSDSVVWAPHILCVNLKSNLFDSVQNFLEKHGFECVPLTALNVDFEVVNYRLVKLKMINIITKVIVYVQSIEEIDFRDKTSHC